MVQAALSLVLLAGAGLMVQTMRNLTSQSFGFDLENTMTVNVNAGFSGYAPEKLASVYAEIERQVRQIPGVRSAALALYTPMSGNNWQMGARLEDKPDESSTRPGTGSARASSMPSAPASCAAASSPSAIPRTRRASPSSTRRSPIRYLQGMDPIGKRLGFPFQDRASYYTIVGVVDTVRFRSPRQPGRPMFFLPMLQMSKAEWDNRSLARSNIPGPYRPADEREDRRTSRRGSSVRSTPSTRTSSW